MKAFWFVMFLGAGSVAYFLRDKSLEQIADPNNYARKKIREKQDFRVVSKQSGLPAKFADGQCVSHRGNEFRNVKIVKVEQDLYRIQECRKYGGCGDPRMVSWKDFEEDYRLYKIVPCY